jgi:two-component sensor histidine kinase
MKLRWLIIALLQAVILLHSSPSPAQQAKLLHYGIDDGLPSNVIYRVYKDRKGVLWLATDKGISCFNGLRFENYSTSDGLPDNEIFFFAEDRQGRLWMGTFNGQLCYFERGRFYTAQNKAFLKLPFKMTVNSFHLSDDGSITMLFSGRKFINIRDTVIKIFSMQQQAQMVRRQRSGTYELLMYDKRIVLDADGRFKYSVPYKKSRYYTLASSGPANEKTFLINGVHIYNLDENLLLDIKEPVQNSYYIPYMQISGNNYFLCSRSGLYTNNGIVLKDIPVSGMAEDNNGNYWVSTLGKGLYCFSKDISTIKEYTSVYKGTAVQARDFGNAIQFVNTDGQLYKLDKKKGVCLSTGKAAISKVWHPGTFDGEGNYLSLTGNTIRIVGSNGKVREIQSVGFKEVLLDKEAVYANSVLEIFRIDYAALSRHSRLKVLQRYASDNKVKDRIFAFAIDPRSEAVWYCTSTTLYKGSPGNASVPEAWPNFSFRKFAFYEEYLVGYTDRNDLIICNHYDSRHMAIDTVKGHNGVWEDLYPVSSRQLIACSNRNYYLITLSPSTGKPIYTLRAIENPFIPEHAEYICRDSTAFYFFRNGNITAVDKKFLLRSFPPVPVVSISGVSTGNQQYLADSFLAIPYEEHQNIRVKFDAVSFYGKALEYEYCIEGYMNRWERIQGEEINIASLPYGSYNIKVRSKSLSSNYSAEARLHLAIGRPYWATWWFISAAALLALLLLMASTFFILRVIIRKKQREYQISMKYQQLEFKSLNALMNPHFIFNSLNNIQGLINEDNKYAANKYLGIFSSMIRQNMQNIARERITLKQELDLIRNYLKLERLRFSDLLDYRIEVEDGIDIENIPIPALLVQPLVENAVKHGFPGKRQRTDLVHIAIYRENKLLQIEVTDNGVGLKEGAGTIRAEHISYGLDNIRARIAHMQLMEKKTVSFHIAALKDRDGKVAGTRARISIDMTISRS